jgi:hypothetical protein
MATLKKSAYRAKTETFEIKLKRLSLDCRAFANVLNCMPIRKIYIYGAVVL